MKKYNPGSALSFVSKLIQKVVAKQLIAFIDNQTANRTTQHQADLIRRRRNFTWDDGDRVKARKPCDAAVVRFGFANIHYKLSSQAAKALQLQSSRV